MSRPKIISLGEVLWDLFPDGARFGGAPANFACHASILGATVSMISAVGDDDPGREALEILRGFGIDVDSMQVVSDAPTGTVGIELDDRGKPSFTIHEGSAWDQLQWSAEIESRVAQADAVYYGTLGQRSEAARATIRRYVETARQASIPRIVDINLRKPFFDEQMIRESIQSASILKLSDDELAKVADAFALDRSAPAETQLGELLRGQSLDFVVMTRGPQGALLVSADGIIEQEGIETTVRDTVGAGDSFTAAFLVGLLNGNPHEQILKKACEIAAEVCAHLGAVPEQMKRSPL